LAQGTLLDISCGASALASGRVLTSILVWPCVVEMDAAQAAALEELQVASNRAIHILAGAAEDYLSAERSELLRQERALKQREAAVVEREAAVAEREAAVIKVEGDLKRREQKQAELVGSLANGHKPVNSAVTCLPEALATCGNAPKTFDLATPFSMRLPPSPARAAGTFPGTTPLALPQTETPPDPQHAPQLVPKQTVQAALKAMRSLQSLRSVQQTGSLPSPRAASPRDASPSAASPCAASPHAASPRAASPRAASIGANKLKDMFEKKATNSRQRSATVAGPSSVGRPPLKGEMEAVRSPKPAVAPASMSMRVVSPGAELNEAGSEATQSSATLDTTSAGTASSLKDLFEKRAASAQQRAQDSRIPRRTSATVAGPNRETHRAPVRRSDASARRGSEPSRSVDDD